VGQSYCIGPIDPAEASHTNHNMECSQCGVLTMWSAHDVECSNDVAEFVREQRALRYAHKRGTNAHSAKSPPGRTLAADPSIDRCIKAAICNKSAAHAMHLWRITQGLHDEGNFSRARVGHREIIRAFRLVAAPQRADVPHRARANTRRLPNLSTPMRVAMVWQPMERGR
jgi:hypothetical protein